MLNRVNRCVNAINPASLILIIRFFTILTTAISYLVFLCHFDYLSLNESFPFAIIPHCIYLLRVDKLAFQAYIIILDISSIIHCFCCTETISVI